MADKTTRTPAHERRQERVRQWAGEFGSERLRRGIALGYDMTGVYARERAALEFPGWTALTSYDQHVRDRVNPSEAALDLADQARERLEQRRDELADRGLPERDCARPSVHVRFWSGKSAGSPELRFIAGEVVTVEGWVHGWEERNWAVICPVDCRAAMRHESKRLAALLGVGYLLDLQAGMRTLVDDGIDDVRVREAFAHVAASRDLGDGGLAAMRERPGVFTPALVEAYRHSGAAGTPDRECADAWVALLSP